jgi:hypothetical protein
VRRLRARLIAIGIVSACSFSAPAVLDQLVDAPPPVNEPDAPPMVDAYVPIDSGPCSAAGFTCEGPILHFCEDVNATPQDTVCGWGCSVIGGAHCAELQPAGGAFAAADLRADDRLEDKTITAAGEIWNTDTGKIDGVRESGTGVKEGIEFKIVNGVGIFRFKSLTIQGAGTVINVRGANALGISAFDKVDVNAAVLDLRGDCVNNNAGPGGFRGGTAGQSGTGAGAGQGGSTGGGQSAAGAGGGGFGAVGGPGGGTDHTNRAGGGATFGNSGISVLAGGAGAGGGGDSNGGRGGGGGGAIQIISNGTVHFAGGNGPAGVNAGGCAGQGGTSGGAGGGGGAGGTILIEAPIVKIDGPGGLAVNGGGGGGGDNGKQGVDALFATAAASGGAGGGGGAGGAGGARGSGNLNGRSGGDASRVSGGGGGGVGRIRFDTQSGLISVNNGFLSPSLGDDQSSTTQGLANVQ